MLVRTHVSVGTRRCHRRCRRKGHCPRWLQIPSRKNPKVNATNVQTLLRPPSLSLNSSAVTQIHISHSHLAARHFANHCSSVYFVRDPARRRCPGPTDILLVSCPMCLPNSALGATARTPASTQVLTPQVLTHTHIRPRLQSQPASQPAMPRQARACNPCPLPVTRKDASVLFVGAD